MGRKGAWCPAKTALYRHFDSDGELLYVGITVNPLQRLAQHKQESEWMQEIARIEIEWFQSYALAMDAEIVAINKENPTYNRLRPPASSANNATMFPVPAISESSTGTESAPD